jgi:hypothetical protein
MDGDRIEHLAVVGDEVAVSGLAQPHRLIVALT